MNKFYKIAMVIIAVLMLSCTAKEEQNSSIVKENYEVVVPLSKGLATALEYVKIESKVLPILREKQENTVLEWTFQVRNTETPLFLKSLVFSLKGSENVADFAHFTLSYKNEKANAVFGEKQHIFNDNLLTFTDKIKLAKGKNTFRLMCQLAPNANIHNHLVIKPIEMTIGKKNYKLKVGALQRKLGIALLKHGQNNVDTYRIPGLVTTQNGTLVGVYDMRYNSSKDLQGNIDVGMSRSTDGGQTWETSKVIIDMGKFGNKPEKLNGVGDPSILYDGKNNTLWVSALWLHGFSEKDASWYVSKEGMSPDETGQIVLVKSTDDGKTWSKPQNITQQIKNPKWQLVLQGPGKGITLGDSILVFPAQFKEAIAQKAIDGGKYTPFSTIMYSKDGGNTWKIGTGAKSNTTEAQLIALNDGSLLLNMRDDRNRNQKGSSNGRAIATTKDLGATWTTHPTSNSALIEPNCMASIIKEEFMVSGNPKKLVIFSNPNSKEGRKNISIKVSFDDAQTWHSENTTLIDAGYGRGYSCLTKIDAQHVGILYEGSGADLVFQVFHIRELLGNE